MRHTITALLILALAIPVIVAAQQLTPEQISRRAAKAEIFGWEGGASHVRMILTDADGSQKTREMKVFVRRDDDLLQTVVRFLAPPKIAGTAFLTRERKGGAAEQHIYLPGLKRTRRIAGREREGSFMGSDFTYADMQGIDEQYVDTKQLPNEKLGDTDVHVLVSTVDDKAHSQYSKIKSWIRTSDYVALRTKFFDDEGKLLKTMYARRVREVDGSPVVVHALVKNAQTGHQTELVVDSLERRKQLPDTFFTPSSLEHM